MPMRNPKGAPPDLSQWKDRDQAAHQSALVLPLKLITPLFGGSAVPRETNPEDPIRAASIRGHLRFWWRATYGIRYSTASALHEAEEALWGSAKVPGKAALSVAVLDHGSPAVLGEIAPPAKGKPEYGPGARYFLFPYQKDKNHERDAEGLQDVRFVLKLWFPEEMQYQVQGALRAWITFGGVGARTRRGCGSLQVTGDQSAHFLPKGIGGLSGQWLGLPEEVVLDTRIPHLYQADLLWGKANNPMDCWRQLGRFWARFRKGHFMTKDDGADLTAMDGNLEAVTETDGGARFASPVILKPVAMSDGTFRPLILVLNGPLPKSVSVSKGGPSRSVKLRSPSQEFDPVLAELGSNHPLDALLVAAVRFGFEERNL